MIHLSSTTLTLAHKVLLQLYRSTSPDELRALIPLALSALIPCDRTSLNELDLHQGPKKVIPHPVPSWWARLGEAYQEHYTEHPLLNREHPAKLLETISLDDRCYAETWKQSLLNHEYFIPLGLPHQLSVALVNHNGALVGIAANRSTRGFTPQERALLDLLNPHIAQAWKNSLAFAELQQKSSSAASQPEGDHALVAVNGDPFKLECISTNASHLLRKYFDLDSEGNGRLPDILNRWLRAGTKQLSSPDTALSAPAIPLVVSKPAGRLTIRLIRTVSSGAVLLLRESELFSHTHPNAHAKLTRRENDILDWMIEGKRSSEIATILGISTRTVEKHIENIFPKLGVETRSAAIRQILELRKNPHA